MSTKQRDWAEDRATCGAASKEPWHARSFDALALNPYDLRFILAAREGWPAALAEIERRDALGGASCPTCFDAEAARQRFDRAGVGGVVERKWLGKAIATVEWLYEQLRYAERVREDACSQAVRSHDEAVRLHTEAGRLLRCVVELNHEVEQSLGKALEYPPLYPLASEVDDGQVGVGDHTAETIAAEAAAEIVRLRSAIRQHRDERGDDRCHADDGRLYAVLPEGDTRPARETAVTLENCAKYIECRQTGREYISPQRRIEELEAENLELEKQLAERAKRIEQLEVGLLPFAKVARNGWPGYLPDRQLAADCQFAATLLGLPEGGNR